MRIISLTVENFMRVEAAEIRPDGTMVVIAGPNEAGKSALMGAIWVALGGDAPEMPIRKGQDRARLALEVGDDEIAPILVERVYTASGMRLKVSQEHDGARIKYDSPQAMLTAMLSGIAFDPEAFSRMPAKEQAALLSSLTGLDTSDLDVEHKRIYAERADIGRQGKSLGNPTLPEGPAPERVDVAALVERLRAGEAHNRAGRDESMSRIQERERITRQLEQAGKFRREAKRLREEAEEADSVAAQMESDEQRADSALEALPALPAPFDAAPVETAIATAESRNAAVREYEATANRIAAVAALRTKYEGMTAKLAGIAEERATRIAECAMPVDGLAIEDGAVLFEGVPYSQASSARKLEIGFAIGRAQNPKLKVVRIENGSLLDSRMLAVVERECDEHGYQAWIERVADSDSGVGIYIEDGVVAPRDAAE